MTYQDPLASHVRRTPLLKVPDHDGAIYLKLESMQAFGSYKIRGVVNAVSVANLETLRCGLVAASAGNMAQAVAFAAKTLNVPCQIFVPETAPDVKKNAIRQLGATLIERHFAEIWSMVTGETPPSHPGVFIHPTRTPGLLEGYGTIVREIIEDVSRLDAVVVPFGVGGLSLGIARALREINPQIKLYLCEPETAAPFAASLKQGRPCRVERQPSFVDAIGTPQVLEDVFAELQPLVEDVIVVTLPEVRQALRRLLIEHKTLAEGAGAAAYAAALSLQKRHPHQHTAAIISGGNIGEDVLRRELEW